MLTTGYWYLEPAPQRHHASQDWQKLPSGIQIAVASRIKQGKAWTPWRACIFMARYYLSSHLHAPLPTTENKIISYVLMVWFTCQTLGAVTAGAWFWYLLRFSCAFCEWLVLSTEKWSWKNGVSVACLLMFWSTMLHWFPRNVSVCGLCIPSTCLSLQVRCPEKRFSYTL